MSTQPKAGQHREFVRKLSKREACTITAALQWYMSSLPTAKFDTIATAGNKFLPMDDDDVQDLCIKIIALGEGRG